MRFRCLMIALAFLAAALWCLLAPHLHIATLVLRIEVDSVPHLVLIPDALVIGRVHEVPRVSDLVTARSVSA